MGRVAAIMAKRECRVKEGTSGERSLGVAQHPTLTSIDNESNSPLIGGIYEGLLEFLERPGIAVLDQVVKRAILLGIQRRLKRHRDGAVTSEKAQDRGFH